MSPALTKKNFLNTNFVCTTIFGWPTLRMCGQCSSALQKKGFVTPSITEGMFSWTMWVSNGSWKILQKWFFYFAHVSVFLEVSVMNRKIRPIISSKFQLCFVNQRHRKKYLQVLSSLLEPRLRRKKSENNSLSCESPASLDWVGVWVRTKIGSPSSTNSHSVHNLSRTSLKHENRFIDCKLLTNY